MITQRKHRIICQLFFFWSFEDISSTVFPLPLSRPLLSRPVHRLVAILGPPFCFSLCWVCLLDPMTSFLLYCPFFCFCQSVPATKNFLGKGAWEVKIWRPYSCENVCTLDWLVVWNQCWKYVSLRILKAVVHCLKAFIIPVKVLILFSYMGPVFILWRLLGASFYS